jgi:hypothetical protein
MGGGGIRYGRKSEKKEHRRNKNRRQLLLVGTVINRRADRSRHTRPDICGAMLV